MLCGLSTLICTNTDSFDKSVYCLKDVFTDAVNYRIHRLHPAVCNLEFVREEEREGAWQVVSSSSSLVHSSRLLALLVSFS